MTDVERDRKRYPDWVSRKMADPSFRLGVAQEAASIAFVDGIAEALDAARISRSDLAKRMGRTRAFVTQALRRGRNLTIRTMVEISSTLGYDLQISLRPRGAASKMIVWTMECAPMLQSAQIVSRSLPCVWDSLGFVGPLPYDDTLHMRGVVQYEALHHLWEPANIMIGGTNVMPLEADQHWALSS